MRFYRISTKQTTKKKKGSNIINYQISHIIEERTSNPYLFTAPWMVVYVPKIIDPFTGHESQEYSHLRSKFVEKMLDEYEDFVNDYNEFIREIYKGNDKLSAWLKNPANFLDERNRITLIVALSPIIKDVEMCDTKKRKEVYHNLLRESWWNKPDEELIQFVKKSIH